LNDTSVYQYQILFSETMIFRRIAAVVAVTIMTAVSAFAQSGANIKLKLTDSETGEAVGFATVSLTPAGSEKATKYVLSSEEGNVLVEGVKKGKYVLKAELLGYKPFSKEIEVAKDNIELGEVKLVIDQEVLNAASVSAVGNPITIKKDTVEYNASSFKTTDNDMLEQLLKKLPGIEVSEDGTVKANGQEIKKITIDGKTFFLDDPQLASKNIPAKIVNKVKVVEKKSDQAMFTGIDDGNEETIIDLSIRPGMMNGWFGNVMAGGGHDMPSTSSAYDDGRYQGAAMVGRFTEKSQISVILNGNNTNNRGFNDMAGSMMGNMRGGGGGMGRGQGGWGMGNGITTSWMGGMNGAFTLCDGDMDLAGNYLYNGTSKSVKESSYKNTTLSDGQHLLYNNDGYDLTRSDGHRFGVRLEHKFSEKTSILFEPQVNFGKGNFTDYSNFDTDTQNGSLTNKTNTGFSSTNGYNDNVSTSGFLLFRQRLGKAGRTVSANIRYSYSNNNLDGYNQSLTSSDWNKVTSQWEKDEYVNQRYVSNSNSASVSGRASYTEPIAKKLFLEANYEYSWNESKSNKDTYNSPNNVISYVEGEKHLIYNPVGETYDPIYSNTILNRYINQRGGLNLQYQTEKTWAQVGIAANPTDTKNTTNDKTYDSFVIKWAPQLMFGHEFSENSNIRVFYFGNSNQPSTSQLMSVPDNSDPLNISFGNPSLKPYFNHSLRGRYGYTNKETFFSVNTHFGGSLVQNPIVNATWYDAAGVRYAIPVNGPNSGNANARVFINAPIAKSNFTIFNMTMADYSQSSSYQGTGTLDMSKYYNPETAVFDYEKFNNDYPDMGKSKDFELNKVQTVNVMERIRFTYRNDFVELTAGGMTRFSRSYYSLVEANKSAQNQWNNQVNGSMNWTIPGGIGLVADANYNWYRGYTTEQPSEIIVNAEINKLLFKQKVTIALKAYDIFDQAKNLSTTYGNNYVQEVRNNTLGRYIILSLTYRFGKFKGQNGPMGGRGPMGGPMGGRGPMGGGPMGPR